MSAVDRMTLLDDDGRQRATESLAAWTVSADRIARQFAFRNFSEAFGFMTRVALVAEQLDHHPEWSNVWNKVDVEITNHDAGGLTELDVEFCRRVDAIVGSD